MAQPWCQKNLLCYNPLQIVARGYIVEPVAISTSAIVVAVERLDAELPLPTRWHDMA